MSKGLGQKIAIKFTEELVNVAVAPAEGYPELMTQAGTVTYSNQYSATYAASKAFDASTSSYWRTDATLPQWIQIELATAISLTKMMWYISNIYYPSSFELLGSNDGINFNTVYSNNNNSNSAAGWQIFTIYDRTPYRYFRWNIFSSSNNRIYIYDIQLYYKEFQNEKAFKITGQREKHIGSEINVDETYLVEKIELHATEPNTLLLTMGDLARFNNAVGDVTINYDKALGSLAGLGGAVESFEVTLTPTELVPVPNPHVSETSTVAPTVEVDFTRIYYTEAQEDETFTVTPSCTVVFTYVGEINP